MTSETFLDKARRNLEIANLVFINKGEDDCFLCFVDFYLQQAVELSIKHGMECYGIEYPKTHDITMLILKCKEEGLDLGITEYVDEHSEMFTLWEAKTRDVKNYRLEYDKVYKALKGVSEFIEAIDTYTRDLVVDLETETLSKSTVFKQSK